MIIFFAFVVQTLHKNIKRLIVYHFKLRCIESISELNFLLRPYHSFQQYTVAIGVLLLDLLYRVHRLHYGLGNAARIRGEIQFQVVTLVHLLSSQESHYRVDHQVEGGEEAKDRGNQTEEKSRQNVEK